MAEENVQLPTKDELAQLSREACIAYAARCALRVLPFTAEAATDAVWGKDSAQHLESVVRAVQVAIAACTAPSSTDIAVRAAAKVAKAGADAAARDANDDAAGIAADVAAETAKSVSLADGAASVAARVTIKVAGPSLPVSMPVSFASPAGAVARADWRWLKENKSSIIGLFAQPLWQDGRAPDRWMQTYQTWREVMVAHGLFDLAKQVDGWMHGDFESEAMVRDLKAWVRRVGMTAPSSGESAAPEARRSKAAERKRTECSASVEGDQPATQDTLGRDQYAAVLADFIADKNTKPPLAISIEGTWGSGKSTFIKLLRKALKAREEKRGWLKSVFSWAKRLVKTRASRDGKRGDVHRVFFCQFNPWRYQNHEELWAAFALQFLKDLHGQVPWWKRFWRQLMYEFSTVRLGFLVRDGLNVLMSGVALLLVALVLWSFALAEFSWVKLGIWWGIRASIGVAIYGVLKALWNARKEVGGWLTWRVKAQLNKPDYASRIGFLEQFHSDFDKVVKAYVGENERVVAFIDDLDRCDVPVAAELMRGINLMLNESDRVVFILGLDRAKVAAGLAVKHQDLLPYLYAQQLAGVKDAGEIDQHLRLYGLEYGHEFIEKFIQLSFRLPAPSGSEIEGFLRKKLKVEPSQPQASKGGVPVLSQRKSERTDAPIPPPPATTPASSGPTSPPVAGPMTKPDAPAPADDKPFVIDESQMLPALKHAARVFDGNPRRINQLINLVRLQLRLSARLRYDLSAGQIAKWTAISLRWPRFVLGLASLSRKDRDAFLNELCSDYKMPESAYYRQWRHEPLLLELFRDVGPGDQVPPPSEGDKATERAVLQALAPEPGEIDYVLKRPQILDWLLHLNLAIPIAKTTDAAGGSESSGGARSA